MAKRDEPPSRASWRALEPQVLTDERLLGERSRQLLVVRVVLAAAIFAGAFVGLHVAGIRELDVGALIGAGAVVLAYDVVAWGLVAKRRDGESEGIGLGTLRVVTYGAIVLDYAVLGYVAWHTGGARSVVLSFFLLHAIVSGVMLGKRPALALHLFAYLLLSALVGAEWAGLLAPTSADPAISGGSGPLDGRFAIALVASYGLMFAITGFVLTSFSSTVRRHERMIREANAELTRLSEMRRDFLDIALHNLQSPLAAVRMHVGNVVAGLGGPVTDQQRKWLERSVERMAQLSEFMRALSVLSTLEAVRIDERAAPVDIAKMLEDVVRDHQDAAQQRRLVLGLGVPLPTASVLGMELLLREAVVNYVTNAVKYVQEGGHVVVQASLVAPDRVRVEVGDDGPGIAPEDQRRLFQEFVRLRDKGKPVAKAHGSGLGLTIVRRVAELHGGTAGVVSEVGRGSTFWLELPLAPPTAAEPPQGPPPADAAPVAPIRPA